ncbi:hypothetical protein pipiens_008485 [Culex pipiens pipiens]|uniref:Uncharacterized protein n=1 Tax=Culex pipiens pipiens TaxID=38569 RepID=A0ABD1DL19_CULPP
MDYADESLRLVSPKSSTTNRNRIYKSSKTDPATRPPLHPKYYPAYGEISLTIKPGPARGPASFWRPNGGRISNEMVRQETEERH